MYSLTVSAIVVGALDLAQMRDLVDDGVGLGLPIAGLGVEGQPRQVQIAVHHVAGLGDCIRKDALGARVEAVGAVERRHPGVEREALVLDLLEHAGHGPAGGLVRGLVELLHARVRAERRGLRGGLGQADAVAQRRPDDGVVGPRAVRLDDRALLVEDQAGEAGLLAVNVGLNLVGGVGDGAGERVGSFVGEGDAARGRDVELAAVREIADLRDIKRDFGCLPGVDVLECTVLEHVICNGQMDTAKGNFLVFDIISSYVLGERGNKGQSMVPF